MRLSIQSCQALVYAPKMASQQFIILASGEKPRPFSSSRAQRSLASYLDLSRHFESSVASDEVFAMRGLLDGAYHRFVGQCYIDGMMDGEISSQCDAEPKDRRIFNIQYWTRPSSDRDQCYSMVERWIQHHCVVICTYEG
jgi:hypothetical protein